MYTWTIWTYMFTGWWINHAAMQSLPIPLVRESCCILPSGTQTSTIQSHTLNPCFGHREYSACMVSLHIKPIDLIMYKSLKVNWSCFHIFITLFSMLLLDIRNSSTVRTMQVFWGFLCPLKSFHRVCGWPSVSFASATHCFSTFTCNTQWHSTTGRDHRMPVVGHWVLTCYRSLLSVWHMLQQY